MEMHQFGLNLTGGGIGCFVKVVDIFPIFCYMYHVKTRDKAFGDFVILVEN